jgi:thioredoxin reductase (NADPH)
MKKVLELVTGTNGFVIKTDEKDISSIVVIIASGSEPRSIELTGQSKVMGKKLFYEIKDIPPLQREDTFMIIGSGDAAFDYALNLANRAKRVDILMRSGNPKCLSLLEERVKLQDNIFIHPDILAERVEEKDGEIRFHCAGKEEDATFSATYGLLACGRDPNLAFLSEEMKNRLEFKGEGETNISGLFIGGDVKSGHFRQVGIAVGDGILCAMKAQDHISEEKKK